MKKYSILNIGAGKVDLNQINEQMEIDEKIEKYTFYVFLDRSYKEGHSITEIEKKYSEWLNEEENPYTITCFSNLDIFDFLDSYKFKFNKIEAYRIFEHMDYCSGEIGRLLEACNMITPIDGQLEIIVPNAIKLTDMLKIYEISDFGNIIELMKQKLIINTEFVNCKADPHASVWTPRLAREYIESEGTWKVEKLESDFIYACRDIYMYILCSKM